MREITRLLEVVQPHRRRLEERVKLRQALDRSGDWALLAAALRIALRDNLARLAAPEFSPVDFLNSNFARLSELAAIELLAERRVELAQRSAALRAEADAIDHSLKSLLSADRAAGEAQAPTDSRELILGVLRKVS